LWTWKRWMFDPSANSEKLKSIGIKATLIYGIALVGGIPVLLTFGLLELRPISLNEIGDFLAGLFGPIAFLWLVLGFLLQSAELRNSVTALKLQAKELQASVQQQKELVAVTASAIEFEKLQRDLENQRRRSAISPRFSINFNSEAGLIYQTTVKLLYLMVLTNDGDDSFDLECNITPPLNGLKNFKLDALGSKSSHKEAFHITRGIKTENCSFDFTCRDKEGNEFRQTIEVNTPQYLD